MKLNFFRVVLKINYLAPISNHQQGLRQVADPIAKYI